MLSTPIPAAPNYWPADRFPYSIAYDPEVLEQIRAAAPRASSNGASDAERTWGLLWGTHDGIKVEILACSPVSHPNLAKSSDPSLPFALLPSLRRAFFNADRPRGLLPLGFYRRENGGNISFSEDDARALAELFPEPWQFVMVLYSGSDHLTKIRLFFRMNDGSIGTDSAVCESSPGESDTVRDSGIAASPQDYSGESNVPPGFVKFRPPTRPPRVSWRSRLWPILAWSIGGIAVAAIALEFRGWNTHNLRATDSQQSANGTKNRSQQVGFPLRAEIRESKLGAVIRLRWDPATRAIRNSPVGILSVSDGSLGREFVFRRQELDLGYTDYPPVSDEVTFRLMVEDAGGPKQEALLVLLGGHEAGHAESELAPQPSGEIAHSYNKEPVHASSSAQPQRSQGDIVPQRTDNSTDSLKSTSQQRPENTIAHAGDGHEALLNAGPAPKISQEASSISSPAVGQLGVQRIPLAPPAPIPPSAAQSKLEFVPPAVVERVPPVLPYSMQRLAYEDLRIRVRVEIDAAGKVTDCRPVSPPSGVYKYLAAVARETLKQWRFSPGRLGGKPVASETVLDLDFSNER